MTTEESIDIFFDLVRCLLRYLRDERKYMSDDTIEYFINKCKTVLTMDYKNNPWFGWILEDNPNFWEDNGYKKIIPDNDYHYYGCSIAKANHYPVYRKHLYICHDMEDDSCVEVFPCELGSIKDAHIVSIHTWNNAGGCKFSLDIAKQIHTIDAFNKLIMEHLGDNLEAGSYLKKDRLWTTKRNTKRLLKGQELADYNC